MSVADDIAEVQRLAATLPDHDAPDLSALESGEEVLGFLIASARASGEDECDLVETLVRAIPLAPDDVRAAERVLRALGYRAVSDRLRQIAGRRKRDLRPIV
jgi:hypothetical protein